MADIKSRHDTSVKFVGNGKVGGYLVVFGDADTRDLQGEFFTAKTEFNIDWYEARPALYHHGLDGEMKSSPVGKIYSLKVDDIGIWAEAQLDMHKEYVQAVQKLVDKGILHWSSGSLAHLVEVSKSGEIKKWPLVEGSLTPTPAEPRKTNISTIKSSYNELGLNIDKLNIQTDKPRIDAEKLHRDVMSDDESNTQNDKIDDEEDNIMPEELMALLESMREQIAEIAASMGATDPDKAADEVVDEIKADDEDMEDIPEEEKAKALSEKAFKLLTAKVEKQLKAARDAKKALNEQARKYARTLEADDDMGGFSTDNPAKSSGKKLEQVSVAEMRRYASHSAEEMALAVKLAISKIPEYERAGLTMQKMIDKGIISESFVKTMANKGSVKLAGWNPRDDALEQNDYASMKTFRFLKADELGATDIAGQGAEWVELLYDTQAWRRVREETELFNIMSNKGMRVRDIPTGVKGMNVKLVDGSGTVYTHTEGGSTDSTGRPEVTANPSFLTTNEVEKNLSTHVIAEGFTFQLAERSMLNIAQELNEDIITTLAESLEDAFINGDNRSAASTNINLIDDTPATGLEKPLYMAWNGLRYNPLIDNTSFASDNAGVNLVAIDYEKVRALWPLRVRRRKQGIVFVIDEAIETQTRRLAEAFTVGVAGDKATFFSGDLDILVGYDVYASSFLRKSNGAGKISTTSGNNTQGQIMGVYAPYWQYGRQLQINIEEDRFALSQASIFVATVNHLLIARSEHAAVIKYDIGV